MQPSCHILLLSDGRPGHFRQSEAIATALGRSRTVTVERIELTIRRGVPKALVPRLARLLPPALFLRAVHGLDATAMRRPDVIVSAGGSTLGANAAMARLLGAPNVFCGSVRGLDPRSFALILLPYPSAAAIERVKVLPKPTSLDPDRLPKPRPIAVAADLAGARACILIGGPTPSAAFDWEDWAGIARLIATLVSDRGMTVTLVTSRRTPAEAYRAIDDLVARAPAGIAFVDYRATGAGSIDQAIGSADLVFVTADSMSMMTEAALSRRPAIALLPRKRGPHRDDEAVRLLETRRLLATAAIASLKSDDLPALIGGLVPMATNHLDELAEVVLAAIAAGDRKA